MVDPEKAWALVCEWTESESLRGHMWAVGAAMAAYARQFGEEEALWRTVGLLHDFDYERYPEIGPEGHPLVGVRHLTETGWPDEITHAILAHAAPVTGVEPCNRMEETLVAVDELTGLITAVALVRPSKNIGDVTVRSVKKKWKDRRFAAGVNREEIAEAADALHIPLDQHIGSVLAAMQDEAEALGLAGEGGDA
ncbi:MAG: HDIG domain-containing protein [Anaerolineales bacterium]|nr:HDIG domain-containing protein [Anaerolineales bacterium]MCB9129235.1 HDIG domain-containing protein [Ardenticatenales bacterium]